MLVLGIETSCDDTAAAVWDDERGLLSNAISSQEEHIPFGGVVPELASRAHLRMALPMIERSLDEAKCTLRDLDGIAVTYGPGLVGSLLIGLSVAKALAFSLGIPLVGIHHIEGHIFAGRVEHAIEPPFIALVVSGGHTELIFVPQFGTYERMGRTRDDAAGEAFDKVAKMLKIGYPGGPLIDKLSRTGKASIDFPRAYLEQGSLDFSFSGVKSAVLRYLEKLSPEAIANQQSDISASFQRAVVDVLADKTLRAARSADVETIVAAGGVAANSELRRTLCERGEQEGFRVRFPSPIFCTDNAAMIAYAGWRHLAAGRRDGLDLDSFPRKPLTSWR
ncbi:MAG: tRNA (adenosine(37)-N6)-threonylcarbamoyltransferase complex transferase subunit TsaD [Candidatus Latescibacteria bacterium]|nr:tRNA (adenosine(37)-N6)-threonylcarbamoyltransferase complex transferase subunit TsaD [Candidatus Latescibacterota bacterium]